MDPQSDSTIPAPPDLRYPLPSTSGGSRITRFAGLLLLLGSALAILSLFLPWVYPYLPPGTCDGCAGYSQGELGPARGPLGAAFTLPARINLRLLMILGLPLLFALVGAIQLRHAGSQRRISGTGAAAIVLGGLFGAMFTLGMAILLGFSFSGPRYAWDYGIAISLAGYVCICAGGFLLGVGGQPLASQTQSRL